MKIGIDARPLSHELTGIGRYTYNVLINLFEQYPGVEWLLYSDRPLLIQFKNPNVHIRTGSCRHSLISTIFSQLIFPLWVLKDQVDTFWSPRHHLPILLYSFRKLRKVVTVHDLVWKKHPETMSRAGRIVEQLLFPLSVRIADSIITVSDFTKSELLQAYEFTANKTRSVPLQSFIQATSILKRTRKPIKDRYILFVGTLEPRKNLNNLLRGFKKVVLEHQELKMIIVGKNGWGELSISALVNELELEKSVIVSGFVPDNHLLSLYMHCDILAMPSLYEGFGLPALEALSMRRKVVVSSLNAIAEIRGDNIFITDTDEVSIANTLCYALGQKPINYADIGSDWTSVAHDTFKSLYKEAPPS